MKKPIALVLSAALLTLSVSPVVALGDTLTETTSVSITTDPETTDADEGGNVVDSDGKVVNPGTLPDSPLYWLDELIEKLQIALAFSPEKKIKLMEKHACERLAEALAIAQKVSREETATDTEKVAPEDQENITTSGDEETNVTQPASPGIEKKVKAFEKALKGYDVKIAHAQEFLAQIQDTESEKAQKLQEALGKVNANNVVVLGSLLEKLPPQAAQRVAVNIVRSMEKAIEKMEKMEAKKVKPVQESEQSDVAEQEDVAQDKENASTTPAESIETGKTNEKTVVPTKILEKYAAKSRLTKSEYKELKKEAHEALKEFQEDLGLKGPHKDYQNVSKDSKRVVDKKVDRDRDDNRGKGNQKVEKSKWNNHKHD